MRPATALKVSIAGGLAGLACYQWFGWFAFRGHDERKSILGPSYCARCGSTDIVPTYVDPDTRPVYNRERASIERGGKAQQ